MSAAIAISDEEWEATRAASVAKGIEAVQESLGVQTLPAVLLPYQQELLATTALHPFVVCEKSRRIGMTWAVGADAVLTSAAAANAGGMDSLYIGYNLDMAREFIDVCAMWAKAFMPAASAVEEFIFKDQSDDGADKDIAAFRIKFASGFEIIALTSKPRSLRGRQGYVIFDEAAFHDALGELIKAAMALLMWGGKVLVISTHDGIENPFNELIEDIRAGKRKGKVVRVTFDEAIADGLYERIALVKKLPANDNAQAKWVKDTREFYGDDAGEELDVAPKSGSGVYISRAAIEACMTGGAVVRRDFPADFELRSMPEREAYTARWIEDEIAPILAALDPLRLTGLGEDFARSSDLSVIAVGQENVSLGIDVPLMIEMRNAPIASQKMVLRAVFKSFKRFGGACFDASGNGLGLSEWAQDTYGYDRIEGIKINSQWYLETMPPLKAHFEDQTISLAKDAFIRDDLRAIKLVRGIPSLGDERKAKRHGDAAIALAMLVRAMKMDVVEIDFSSAGARLPEMGAFVEGGVGNGAPAITDTGWGTVSSGLDLSEF